MANLMTLDTRSAPTHRWLMSYMNMKSRVVGEGLVPSRR